MLPEDDHKHIKCSVATLQKQLILKICEGLSDYTKSVIAVDLWKHRSSYIGHTLNLDILIEGVLVIALVRTGTQSSILCYTISASSWTFSTHIGDANSHSLRKGCAKDRT